VTLPNYERPRKQIREVQGASSGQTVAVAPIARSIGALMVAIGIPDDDMNGTMDVLVEMESSGAEMPKDMRAVVQQMRAAYAAHLERQASVIDPE
jgi:hypothetical protein